MPVPNTVADLAQSAAANYPVGSEPIGNSLDNYLRAHASLIRQFYALGSASLPAGSSVNVSAADGESVLVTGAATINSLGPGYNGCLRELRFDGACTLTHSANLQLPGAANVVTAAGDVYAFRCIGAGTWVLIGGKSVPVGALPGHLPAWSAIDPSTKQAALGYTPVQQGTGVGQGGNAVKIGWASGSSKIKVTIDSTDQGNIAMEPWVTALAAALYPKSGGTLSGGLNFGSVVASGPTDLSKHVALYASDYGFSITANRLNYVAPSAAGHRFLVNGVDCGWVDATGVNDAAGPLRDIPQVFNPGTRNLSQADAGRSLCKTNGTAQTVTVQPIGTVPMREGSAVTFMNAGGTANNLIIARGSGVAFWRNGANADITLTPGQTVTLLYLTANVWQA